MMFWWGFTCGFVLGSILAATAALFLPRWLQRQRDSILKRLRAMFGGAP
jgi:hypothetical protein